MIPRSPLEADHNYVTSPKHSFTPNHCGRNSPVDQSRENQDPRPAKSESSSSGSDSKARSLRSAPKPDLKSGRGRKKAGTPDSRSSCSGGSNSSKGLAAYLNQAELIKPVSVKLENCLLQVSVVSEPRPGGS